MSNTTNMSNYDLLRASLMRFIYNEWDDSNDNEGLLDEALFLEQIFMLIRQIKDDNDSEIERLKESRHSWINTYKLSKDEIKSLKAQIENLEAEKAELENQRIQHLDRIKELEGIIRKIDPDRYFQMLLPEEK